uniref:UPAR/Ly6 domain-containing protein n=1 Tax=Fundulus heteroclitus TaxID=8078 RepID=A0A3Q2P7V6_FUNHE
MFSLVSFSLAFITFSENTCASLSLVTGIHFNIKRSLWRLLLVFCCLLSGSDCQSYGYVLFMFFSEFNATKVVSLHTRGCLDSDLCNKTLTGSLIGASYTSTFKCCTTDLCNAGTSAQLSLTVALFTAALSTLRSFWEL